MTGIVRRAGAFAAVGTLALATPALGAVVALAFLAVGSLAALVVSEGRLFELFARPGDRSAGRLNGLAGFALAAAALALMATVPGVGLPPYVFVAAVLLLVYGNLGEQVVRTRRSSPIYGTVGFGLAGAAAGVAGMLVALRLAGGPTLPASSVGFLVAAGTLLAALLRAVLFERDDPLVLVSVGLLLWFLSSLPATTTTDGVLLALVVTLGFGALAYGLGTASIPGMLTGVFLGLLTIVLGGVGWFAVLIAFFAVGGVSTKFRYEEKQRRGVAEENEGARGSGNVLGNSAIALLALLGYAGASDVVAVEPELFLFAFAGAIATAMSDTLSSEIGGVYDDPRLITNLDVVEPGTDGGITWQGVAAGTAGAAIVAVLAAFLFNPVGTAGALAIALGGFVGMQADSILGATMEGSWLGNQGVNFFATLAGALVAVAAAVTVAV